MLDHKDCQVYVQGKTVPFDNKTINCLYGMLNIPYDEYVDYLEHHLVLDEVLALLTIFGIEWKILKDENSTSSVRAIQFEEHKA